MALTSCGRTRPRSTLFAGEDVAYFEQRFGGADDEDAIFSQHVSDSRKETIAVFEREVDGDIATEDDVLDTDVVEGFL